MTHKTCISKVKKAWLLYTQRCPKSSFLKEEWAALPWKRAYCKSQKLSPELYRETLPASLQTLEVQHYQLWLGKETWDLFECFFPFHYRTVERPGSPRYSHVPGSLLSSCEQLKPKLRSFYWKESFSRNLHQWRLTLPLLSSSWSSLLSDWTLHFTQTSELSIRIQVDT